MLEQDILKKIMLTGLGIIDITKEKAEKIVDELVKRGEVAESESKKYAEDLFKKAKDLEENLKTKIEKIITEKEYATKKEIQEVNEKLDKILRKLG